MNPLRVPQGGPLGFRTEKDGSEGEESVRRATPASAPAVAGRTRRSTHARTRFRRRWGVVFARLDRRSVVPACSFRQPAYALNAM